MSQILYEGLQSNPVLVSYYPIFAAPLFLRLVLNILNISPCKGLGLKIYFYLGFLSVSHLIYSYFPSYLTFLLILINLQIVLLTSTSLQGYQIPHYLEFFNVICFYSLPFTPVLGWVSAGVTWVISSVNNLMCGSIIGACLGLVQCGSGIACITAVYLGDVDGFYATMFLSLALMIVQVDLFKK